MKVDPTSDGRRVTPALAKTSTSGLGSIQASATTHKTIAQRDNGVTSAELDELGWHPGDPTPLISVIQRHLLHIQEVAALAHDMKSPLATIATSAELLELEMAGEDSAHLLSVIQRQAVRLQHMVQDLAESMRRPDEEPKLCCELIDLNQFMHDLAAESRHVVRSHKLKVNLTPKPIMARLDVEKVRRIFQNLLCNAIQYSPKGTTITVGLPSSTRMGCAVLVVEDEGPGVPQSMREDIFKPFVRLQNTCSGEGLGLHIVRRFAAIHHGEAWVEDGAVGARFCVSLPIEIPASHLLGQLHPNPPVRTRRRPRMLPAE